MARGGPHGKKQTKDADTGDDTLKTFTELKRWSTTYKEADPAGDIWTARLTGLSWQADDGRVKETWRWAPPDTTHGGTRKRKGKGKGKGAGKRNIKGKGKGAGKRNIKGKGKGKDAGTRKGAGKRNIKGKGKGKGKDKDKRKRKLGNDKDAGTDKRKR